MDISKPQQELILLSLLSPSTAGAGCFRAVASDLFRSMDYRQRSTFLIDEQVLPVRNSQHV